MKDGTLINKYNDGTIITQLKDGTLKTQLPDGTLKTKFPDGTITQTAPDNTTTKQSIDGTITQTAPDGTIIIQLKNGTLINKYPDGTIKTQNADGTITENSTDKSLPYNMNYLLTTLAPITAIVNNSPPTSSDEETSNDNQDVVDEDENKDNSNGLDDYVLNSHPVDVNPPSLDETPDLNINNDNGEFLPSTTAYPDSGYAAFDPLNEDINHYEYVAKEFASSQPDGLSDNPMDPNWGGVMYTQNMIKSGKYVDNNVNKPLLFQPKGIFIDNIPSAFGKPKDIY